MGFRFRKSIKVGAARVNFSKSGIGASIGTKGARITRTANGRTRKSVSIPGTGIGYVSESGSKHKASAPTEEYSKNTYKVCGIFGRIVGALIVLSSLLFLMIELKIWYVFLIIGLFFWFVGGSHIKKSKKD